MRPPVKCRVSGFNALYVSRHMGQVKLEPGVVEKSHACKMTLLLRLRGNETIANWIRLQGKQGEHHLSFLGLSSMPYVLDGECAVSRAKSSR